MHHNYLLLIGLVWGFFWSNPVCFSQTDTLSQSLPTRFQDHLESLESEEEVAHLLDRYEYLTSHPFTLQDITVQALNQIPALTSREKNQIYKVVSSQEKSLSWNYLEQNLNDEVIEILRFCTEISPGTNYSGRGRWRLKSSSARDFQMYGKMTLGFENHFFGSIVVERDPGERSLVDHLAGGIEINNRMGISQCVIGQFQLQFGEGLSFGRAMGIAKSGDVVGNIRQSGTSLRVNNSSLETVGFTGLAAHEILKQHEFIAFFTRSPRDGQFEGNDVQLSSTGLHTTEGARSRQNRLVENLAGGAYQFNWKQSQIGMQGSSLSYHNWSGSRSTPPEKFGSVWIRTPYLLHETGIDNAGHRAHYTALDLQKSGVVLVLSHRWYSPYYNAPFARGFGEWSNTANETGLYAGMRWLIGSWRFESYIDQFRELIATDYPPREGTEWMIQSRWRPVRRMKIIGRIRVEQKEVHQNTEITGIALRNNTLQRKTQYRLSWKYRWASGFTVRIRFDNIRVYLLNKTSKGFQSGYRMEYIFLRRFRVSVDLVPYSVESSEASTYYLFMPAYGTMQLSRQTGQGMLCALQLRQRFTSTGSWTLFYLQDRTVSNKITSRLALQIDVAF